MSAELARDLPRGARVRKVATRGVAGLVVLAVAGAAAWVLADRRSGGEAAAPTTAAVTTLVPVARRDLAETESFSGTLGYVRERQLSTQLAGTLTAITAEGSLVKRGQTLFRVGATPVVLMYGMTPAWRALADGVDDGGDVAQLEWNLVQLGYDPNRDVVINDEFDWATTAAVERWQEALGLEETGTVELGLVVFLPGPRRIGGHVAVVGDTVQTGAAIATTSATTQQVVVQLDATRQSLAVAGRRVTVDLPDGTSVPGRIATVGKVAESSSSTGADANASADSSATIEVDISLLRAPSTALDQAPVSVDLTTESRRDVLAVPVTALVATLGGGYAVEVQRGGVNELARVTPGLYAGGYVEITGGLTEGDQVVVPQ